MLFDENMVRKTIALMKTDNQLFEIRVIFENKKVMSGYFTDADVMIRELKKIDGNANNVYMTLNRITAGCYGRSQRDRFEYNPKATTSDNDIVSYDWLMVDLDPKRPSGTSSSEQELNQSKQLANKIFQFMEQLGFEKPLIALSGNGVHLMYRIALVNCDENKKLLEQCLKTLNMLFDNEVVGVDLKNFNPARVCKLYGTMAQKGSNCEDRPHRLSGVINSDDDIKVTDIKYLEKLISLLPKEPDKPQKYNNYNPGEFDLESWMDKYGIRYERGTYSDGMKYILDHCPFDINHKGKDACVFRAKSGAISFHCFHNSCADKGWRELRMMFEPDAYEKQYMSQQQTMYKQYNRDRKPSQPHIEPKDNQPIFYTANEILALPRPNESYIRTGYEVIDKKMRGLKKGATSVVSGLRASAKSTWISSIALNAINDGNNVGVFSGELSEKNFLRWFLLQAAGKNHVEPSLYEGYYNVPYHTQQKIASWIGDRFYLYNNEYGNNFSAILEQFEKAITEKKLDMLILDNLMAFDISDLSQDKYEAQTKFVWSLHDMAIRHSVHILYIAHPRKALGFLRLDDLSGTADLANAVDSAFIVHRNNNDFRRLSKQMFGWKEDDPIYTGTNIVEIAKDRDNGTQDVFIPLWYEKETKRLKNNPAENIIYGWQDMTDGRPEQQTLGGGYGK